TNPDRSQPQPETQVASASPQKTTDSVASNPRPVSSEQDGPANLGQFANIPNTQVDDVPNNEYKVGNQTQLATLNDPNSPTVTGSGAMDQALLESSQFSGMADGDKEIVMEAIANGQLTADEGVEIFNAVQSGEINSEDAILIANGTKELSNVMSEQLASNNTGTQSNEPTQHIDQSGANSSVIEGRDQATTGQFETQLASESTNQIDNSTAPYNGSDNDAEVRESGSQLASTSFEAPNEGVTESSPSVFEASEQPVNDHSDTEVAMSSPNQIDNSTAPYNGSDNDTEVREGGSQLASTSFEAPNEGTTESSPSVFEASEQPVYDHSDTEVAMSSPNQIDNSIAPYNGSDTDTEVRESGSQLASTSFEAPNDGYTDSNPPAPNADLDNNGGKIDIARALTTGDKTNLEMDADEIINGDKLDTVVGLGGSVGEIDGDVNYDQDTKLT
ncbi:hypothetical protein, partial [Vibrio cyclitrophicus]|uniref:hypothetical protein n=1 Tax=Vibrio cyclitrophicus TaxID=47951 RepID=UPI00164477EB